MGFFDSSKSKQIEHLERQGRQMLEKIQMLEKRDQELMLEISKRTSEDEKEARQNSRKVSEFRNKVEMKLAESKEFIKQLNDELDLARQSKDEINVISTKVNEQRLAVDEAKSRIDDAETEFERKLTTINSRIGSIDTLFEKYPNLESQLLEIDQFTEKVEENLEKSGISLTSINKRKKEIDDLHREIFGYSQTDENSAETTIVEGLKDELENTYNDLKIEIDNSKAQLEIINNKSKDNYSNFEKEYKTKYKKINEDIASLLPAALTAGLSSAFSTKKDDEVKSSKKMQRNFNIGIILMVLVSMIPVVISLSFLNSGFTLEQVIFKLPRVVLSIMPMYVPILWFTISASKKFNLSKRLIEEYSHKEVLSKTYEGLSTQIENLEDKSQSEELRYRLLSNFLQVSSENPGKLISNYNTSDHPIMEALEQSYKLQTTLDKVSGIPGIGNIVSIVEKRSKNNIIDKTEKVSKAINGLSKE